MSRLARWLFYLAATNCGLATLAVAGLWVRSYWVTDSVECRDSKGSALLHSNYGVLELNYDAFSESSIGPTHPPVVQWSVWDRYFQKIPHTVRGVPQWSCRLSRSSEGSVYFCYVGAPHWALLLPLLLVDAWLVRRGVVRWRRRRRAGCCEKCGYNLTGNVSGICPECGTPVKSCEP